MLFAIFLAAMLSQPPNVVDRSDGSGNTLLSMCEKYRGNGAAIQREDPLDAISCVEYIRGFVDATTILEGMTSPICLPDRPIYDQQVRVVVKYLRDHPEDLHHPRAILVFEALKTASPCEKVKRGN